MKKLLFFLLAILIINFVFGQRSGPFAYLKYFGLNCHNIRSHGSVKSYNHDLVLDNVLSCQMGLSVNSLGETDTIYTGFYSQMPSEQSFGTEFILCFRDIGNTDQNYFGYHINITNPDVLTVYNIDYYDTTGNYIFSPGWYDEWIQFGYFNPIEQGNYMINCSISSLPEDQNPANNSISIPFMYYGGSTFAHDVNLTGNTCLQECSFPPIPCFPTNTSSGDMFCSVFHIEKITSAQSISVFIDQGTDDFGGQIIAKLYLINDLNAFDTCWMDSVSFLTYWSTSNVELKALSAEHTMTESDVGNWLELPVYQSESFDSCSSPKNQQFLDPKRDYIVGIEVYPSDYSKKIRIGIDTSSIGEWYAFDNTPAYGFNCNVRVGGNYYQSGWTFMIRLKINNSSSIVQDNTLDKILIFPNPASDFLQISGIENPKVEMFSITGQSVMQSRGNKINISSLPSGVYFLRINNYPGMKKIIKI